MIYRAKVKYDKAGEYNYTAIIDGKPITKKIIVLPKCEKGIIIKYLDNNGFYRFWQFERYSERYESKNIGELISIENNKNIIGSSLKRTILASTYVNEEQMLTLKWLFVSPSVEIKLNNKWIKASIGDGNYTIKKAKGNKYQIDVQINILNTYTTKR